MSNKNSSSSGGRIGFTGLLTLLFIGLKLTHYIDWSWWWILSPIWIVIAISLVLIFIGSIIKVWFEDEETKKSTKSKWQERVDEMARKRNQIPCILIILSLILLTSCKHTDKELSYELGRVIMLQYIPDTRSVDVGFGVSSSGHAVTTFTPTGEDEKYIILFQCAHGSIFPIESKRLFSELKSNDSVTICYHNIRTNGGKIVDYDFVDAIKIVTSK